MKEKLEPNMYVRTKDGYIAKFIKAEKYLEDGETIETTSYQFDHNIDKYSDCVNYVYAEDMIVKEPSYNIIDLIEVGDYVNGYPVYEIVEYEDNTRAIVIADDNKSIIWEESYQYIKSIVTKEAFESMSYKVV